MTAPGTLFGHTEAQVAEFGLSIGIGVFILYMLFIIGNLAYRSSAGRIGTFVLFFVLAFGMFGFISKIIIQNLWGI